MREITKWIIDHTNNDAQAEIARKAGVSQPTLNRQMKNNNYDPYVVAAIAKAYKVSAAEPFVAMGLLRESDLDDLSIEEAIAEATDQQLLDEIGRRLANGNTAWDQPLDEVIELPVVSQVSDTNIDIEELRREAAASRKNMEAEQEYWE